MKSIYDEEYRTIIGRIVEYRKLTGVSQSDLAKSLGWDQSMVSKVETFVRRIDIIETKKLCQVLHLSIIDLLRDSDITSTRTS